MQLDHIEGMKYAKTLGMGWRVECWGDMGGFSKTWCHMRSLYPQALEKTEAGEVWKTAPVALETCWDMRRWHKEGWDIDYILKWALEQHASFINNKSAPVPEELTEKVQEWLVRIGYRFVLRSASYDAGTTRGSSFKVDLDWENVGVAPCYFDCHPWLALAREDGQVIWQTPVAAFNLRGRLPGRFTGRLDCEIPSDLPAGDYDLLLSVGTAKDAASVRLAIKSSRADRRYLLGKVSLR